MPHFIENTIDNISPGLKTAFDDISPGLKTAFDDISPGLKTAFDETSNHIEIGVDEAGRGPLFGRLYVAAVVLPKGFYHKDIKDSKKLSDKKIRQMSAIIKENALAWSIQFIEHTTIDEINIRQSVFRGMHASIKETMDELNEKSIFNEYFLLIDGNDFKPYMVYNEETSLYNAIPHQTVEHGDAIYMTIAAASILAKNARDRYIEELCDQYPELIERYGLNKNKGYGTKQHLEGIQRYGITQWHRTTYARCNTAHVNHI